MCRLFLLALCALLVFATLAGAEDDKITKGDWGDIISTPLISFNLDKQKFQPGFAPGYGAGYYFDDNAAVFLSFNFIWGNDEPEGSADWLPTTVQATLGGVYKNLGMIGLSYKAWERANKPMLGQWSIPFGLAGEVDVR